MVKSLKIPVEKLASKNFDSILSRVTSVKNILGSVPDMESVTSSIISGFREYFGVDF